MGQEETIYSALEDDNFDVLVGFKRRDDRCQRRHIPRTKDVDGRDIKDNAPMGGGSAFEPDLLAGLAVVHLDPPRGRMGRVLSGGIKIAKPSEAHRSDEGIEDTLV
jgi:hypothetical protein